MNNLYFVPVEKFRGVREKIKDPLEMCPIFADMCRINTLSMIKEAGSGHLGTSFSTMDILVWLWIQEMQNPNDPGGDIYFSSKGHDAPALYSVLIALEKIPYDCIHKLRRLGGLPGHPDVCTPFIVANTGSLGMGISKARGMALANRLNNKKRHIYVVTGDGELQEGQIWESLQKTANTGLSEITVIVDCNKMQSDTWTRNVNNMDKRSEFLLEQKTLAGKFRSFSWNTSRCDGHDFHKLQHMLPCLIEIGVASREPQVLIADTVKGKGVSFMESTACGENESYKYHAGAPSDEDYEKAIKELERKVNTGLAGHELNLLEFEKTTLPKRVVLKNPEKLMAAYEDELAKIARERKDIVVLDADLEKDCGVSLFKKKFPERFFECGIAEQDMVSVAGGFALQGKLPIVHTYACFLTRACEQIYNNATEKTKIIYVSPMSGLLPAGSGHSHQGVRDIAALGAVPGLTMIQPCNEKETRMALHWAVYENPGSTYLRLTSLPYDLPFTLPDDYKLKFGKGVFLREGDDVAIIAYGPLMLQQAMNAAELLEQERMSTAVINFPWLNRRIDEVWPDDLRRDHILILTLDDHLIEKGQGEFLASRFAQKETALPNEIVSLGLEEIPACGQNDEVLKYHGLDAESIAKKIKESL